MPLVLYLLALAVFAQGTSEFMLAGLLPGIAADLGVSISAAGSLTSAFAVGMIIGAPLMAAAAARWSRRNALLAFLTVFLVVHVIGALTSSYPVLLGTRIVGALADAGFLAVAMVTAAALVPPNAKGRATSVLLAGTTLACVVGVPGGALLGQLWGWRSAFWAVALVSVPAILAILRAVPDDAGGPVPNPREEFGALREPRLLVTLLLGALVNGATFCAFTYFTPVFTEVAGLGEAWVPALLALFGLGSFLGVSAAGRVADVRPVPLLVAGGAALLAGWAAFALLAAQPAVTIALVLVQGTLSFAVGSTLIAQALYAAAGAPALAGGFATAAFNVGAAVGPWAGGAAIAAGLGHRSPLWVSTGLIALALLAAGTVRMKTGPIRLDLVTGVKE
ncbi:Cmx/CmrA family chloramphenicol efflux MFS transporter [Spirillospora sp. NPDC029432]|uniref:Cmx/CmrA family chloramphenicol efflux MFS transporter n=1 Tax=Spirillospora sp. NPDC029432 TaxID=3154599 RepID=UPI0034546CB8